MRRAALTLIALLSLAACETVKGAGQDMQNAGKAIKSEANQTQSGM